MLDFACLPGWAQNSHNAHNARDKQTFRTASQLKIMKVYDSKMGIFGHFFANYMKFFHKTEVQTVILRCLICLHLNWIKSYDIIGIKIFFFHA